MLVPVHGTGISGTRYRYYRWAVRITRACVIHAYVHVPFLPNQLCFGTLSYMYPFARFVENYRLLSTSTTLTRVVQYYCSTSTTVSSTSTSTGTTVGSIKYQIITSTCVQLYG